MSLNKPVKHSKKTINTLMVLVFLCFSQMAIASHIVDHNHYNINQDLTCQLCLSSVFDDDDHVSTPCLIVKQTHLSDNLSLNYAIQLSLFKRLYLSRAPPVLP